MTTETNTARSVFGRLRLSDALLFLYVCVVARQFFWGIESNSLGWVCSAAVSAAIVITLRLRTPNEGEKLPPAFYLIVVVPLALVYLSRMPFPDLAFDVLNYRLAYTERTLTGAQFIPGDFFPYVLTLNPAADTLGGLFQKALGYRLGTVIGLFAVIWTAAIVYRMLGAYVANVWLRAASVLAVLFTEQLLFLAGSYMVDVYTVPLILEATRRVIERRATPQSIPDTAFISVLLGVSCAFKITNLALAIPIAVLHLSTIWRERSTSLLARVVMFGAIFAVPISAHAVYIYLRLGNPLFPAYNAIFRSPYFPPINFRDGRFGTDSFLEALVYPLTSLWQPGRLGELQIYSGRIALGFVLALACVYFVRKETELFRLVLLTIFSSILWSLTTGYVRYVLPLEVYSGLLVVLAAAHMSSRLQIGRTPARLAAGTLLVLLVIQIGFAGYYLIGRDWGGRPTAMEFPREAYGETRFLFRDRDLTKFLSLEDRQRIEQVDVWLISDLKTAGIEALLRHDAPLINIYASEFFKQPDFYARVAARSLLDRTVASMKGRRIYSLCYTENLPVAIAAIENVGLRAAGTTPVRLRFFSNTTVFNMTLIEVVENPAL